MKAYKAWDAKNDDSGCTVVFAENIREAKKIAMSTDACSEADFIDIRVKRFKECDALYKGKPEMDWDDEETRIVMVRDFGWSCLEEYMCDKCPAQQYCVKGGIS